MSILLQRYAINSLVVLRNSIFLIKIGINKNEIVVISSRQSRSAVYLRASIIALRQLQEMQP